MIPVDASRATIRVCDTCEEHITAKNVSLVPGCGEKGDELNDS